MAKARQCDICGKFYIPYSTSRYDKKPNGMVFIINEEDGSTWHKGAPMDLCVNCMISIQDHINYLKTKPEEVN